MKIVNSHRREMYIQSLQKYSWQNFILVKYLIEHVS